jgi:Tannase and feruloyl esterase
VLKLSLRKGLAALITLATALSANAQSMQKADSHPAVVGKDCSSLLKTEFPEMRDGPIVIAAAAVVSDGKNLPEYCRVAGWIGPGKINFEVRMPAASWNGRLMAQGSGGSGGNVNADSCNDVLARDFAIVATDLGHVAGDDLWTGNLQQLLDFSFRATHLTTVAAKQFIRAYYGRSQNYSYFRGCSSGGRAALVNAQRFPGDFDGIIAGDVGNPRAGAYFLPAWIMQSNVGKDGKSILTQAELPKITAAALKACGRGEAKQHGFLDDPLACDFDPASIICPTEELKPNCISRSQAEFVRKVYDGPRNSKGQPVFLGGVRIFGLARGSEMQWANWIARTASPASAPDYASRESWFQEQAFLETPVNRSMKIVDVDFDTDPDRVNAIESLWSASNPDLRALQTLGVKLLSYSGWSDNRVQPEAMIDYYRTASAIAGGVDKLGGFYRLFMVPGMAHCSGGPGADTIDWVSAIVDWVERGNAPESVLGSHIVNGKTEFTYVTPRFKF